MSAKPAEKLVIPIARVRNVGGYWNEVNAGIIAFATPVVLLPEIHHKINVIFQNHKCSVKCASFTYQALLKIPPMSNRHLGTVQCISN